MSERIQEREEEEIEISREDDFYFGGKFYPVRMGTPEDGPEMDGKLLVILDPKRKPVSLSTLKSKQR
jgi:hypothetical protein